MFSFQQSFDWICCKKRKKKPLSFFVLHYFGSAYVKCFLLLLSYQNSRFVWQISHLILIKHLQVIDKSLAPPHTHTLVPLSYTHVYTFLKVYEMCLSRLILFAFVICFYLCTKMSYRLELGLNKYLLELLDGIQVQYLFLLSCTVQDTVKRAKQACSKKF